MHLRREILGKLVRTSHVEWTEIFRHEKVGNKKCEFLHQCLSHITNDGNPSDDIIYGDILYPIAYYDNQVEELWTGITPMAMHFYNFFNAQDAENNIWIKKNMSLMKTTLSNIQISQTMLSDIKMGRHDILLDNKGIIVRFYTMLSNQRKKSLSIDEVNNSNSPKRSILWFEIVFTKLQKPRFLVCMLKSLYDISKIWYLFESRSELRYESYNLYDPPKTTIPLLSKQLVQEYKDYNVAKFLQYQYIRKISKLIVLCPQNDPHCNKVPRKIKLPFLNDDLELLYGFWPQAFRKFLIGRAGEDLTFSTIAALFYCDTCFTLAENTENTLILLKNIIDDQYFRYFYMDGPHSKTIYGFLYDVASPSSQRNITSNVELALYWYIKGTYVQENDIVRSKIRNSAQSYINKNIRVNKNILDTDISNFFTNKYIDESKKDVMKDKYKEISEIKKLQIAFFTHLFVNNINDLSDAQLFVKLSNGIKPTRFSNKCKFSRNMVPRLSDGTNRFLLSDNNIIPKRYKIPIIERKKHTRKHDHSTRFIKTDHSLEKNTNGIRYRKNVFLNKKDTRRDILIKTDHLICNFYDPIMEFNLPQINQMTEMKALIYYMSILKKKKEDKVNYYSFMDNASKLSNKDQIELYYILIIILLIQEITQDDNRLLAYFDSPTMQKYDDFLEILSNIDPYMHKGIMEDKIDERFILSIPEYLRHEYLFTEHNSTDFQKIVYDDDFVFIRHL